MAGCPVLKALPKSLSRREPLRLSQVVSATKAIPFRIAHLPSTTRIASRMCHRPPKPQTEAPMTMLRTPQAPQLSPIMLSTSIRIRTCQVTQSKRPRRPLSAVSPYLSIYHSSYSFASDESVNLGTGNFTTAVGISRSTNPCPTTHANCRG